MCPGISSNRGGSAKRCVAAVWYPPLASLAWTSWTPILKWPKRFVNSEPVAVVTSHLPARIFAGIDKQDLEKQSLYQIFEQVYKRKLRWAEETIGATIAAQEDAQVLETKPGSPLLLISETTCDHQTYPSSTVGPFCRAIVTPRR